MNQPKKKKPVLRMPNNYRHNCKNYKTYSEEYMTVTNVEPISQENQLRREARDSGR